ncbi:NUDIX domain-containing protein [Candidatus Uhrbacteria bacterium]|nr:MAG: NUDIX domain-containing protein [Candidatus Uhrbacteria bacterium]
MNELHPRVGVGVLIFKDGKVLMGRRKNAHGDGEYCGPGGHLEHLETFEECAMRETMEEVGIEITNVRFLCVSNLRKYAPKHYVDIGIVADWKSGEPRVMEPDKREDWAWYDLEDLPSPLFGVESEYIEAYKTGKAYFDC